MLLDLDLDLALALTLFLSAFQRASYAAISLSLLALKFAIIATKRPSCVFCCWRCSHIKAFSAFVDLSLVDDVDDADVEPSPSVCGTITADGTVADDSSVDDDSVGDDFDSDSDAIDGNSGATSAEPFPDDESTSILCVRENKCKGSTRIRMI